MNADTELIIGSVLVGTFAGGFMSIGLFVYGVYGIFWIFEQFGWIEDNPIDSAINILIDWINQFSNIDLIRVPLIWFEF